MGLRQIERLFAAVRDWCLSRPYSRACSGSRLKPVLRIAQVRRFFEKLRGWLALHMAALVGVRSRLNPILVGKGIKRLAVILLSSVVLLVGIPHVTRMWVHHSSQDRISSRIEDVPSCRVAVVLGAKVYPSGRLADLLADRVDAAIELYKAGKVEKILMSGDNSKSHYDEPTRMMEYAVAQGVDPADVKMDFAGRRTYDSMYRAKHIFGLNKFVVVSQSYHLDRAIFLARHMGIDAWGYSSDRHDSPRARMREVPACVSALLDLYILHPKPILGSHEEI